MKVKPQKGATFLNGGIFSAKVFFSCGMTHKEILKFLRKNGHPEWAYAIQDDRENIEKKSAVFTCKELSDKVASAHYCYIILNEPFDFSDDNHTSLAHEIIHACQWILPDFLDRNKEHEAEAYFHTHLMTQCLGFLRSVSVQNVATPQVVEKSIKGK